MAFDDFFRCGAHAIFTDENGKILQLKATYNDKRWLLPGGGLDPEETIHEALIRECREELGVDVQILYLSGVYYHRTYNAQVCIFRATLPKDAKIILSEEHDDYRYFALDELTEVQRIRALDCLNFDGNVKSARF